MHACFPSAGDEDVHACVTIGLHPWHPWWIEQKRNFQHASTLREVQHGIWAHVRALVIT
jgi:hypothetical protein